MKQIRIIWGALLCLVLVTAFQNCGSTMGETTNEAQGASRPTPIAKAISQLTIPISDFSSDQRAELLPDGSVVNLQSGSAYALDPALTQEIRHALDSAQLCVYKLEPLAPGMVSCLALAVPHAYALTVAGEEIPLSTPFCHQDTTDLCQDSRDSFRSLVQKIRQAIAP